MRLLFSALLIGLFLACGNNSNSSSLSANDTTPEADHSTSVTDEIKMPETEAFWSRFQTAVGKRDIDQLDAMVAYPLVNSEGFGAVTDKASLEAGFDKIFPPYYQQSIAKSSFEEISSDTIKTDMAQFDALKASGAQIGALLHTLIVTEVFDEGTDRQTESAILYHFTKVDDNYKLIMISFAG